MMSQSYAQANSLLTLKLEAAISQALKVLLETRHIYQKETVNAQEVSDPIIRDLDATGDMELMTQAIAYGNNNFFVDCELAGANPFDYLTELQRHAAELAANPSAWMPWNYTGQNH